MKSKSLIYIWLLTMLGCPLWAGNSMPVSVRIDPLYLSPNADGVHDQVFFYPILPSQTNIQRWRLDIFNDRHRRIQRLTGAGISALIKWELQDKKNTIIPDGEYSVQLDLWTNEGHFHSNEQPFYVDTVAPEVHLQVSTNVISPFNEGHIVFTPTILDSGSVDRWQIQILNQTGSTADVLWSTETAHPIEWEGKARKTGVGFPSGNYTCILQAWDKAGNESAHDEVKIYIESTPSQSLRQILKRISIYETYIGLITPIQVQEIFSRVRGKWVITPQGEALLKEVGLLVNAYPDRSIRLDGYSRGLQKADHNRDMSSVWAWMVYSDLVKKENVKASRITVRGRGKSPMFDRRSVQPNVVQDGVEILVEGSPPW